MDVASLAVVLSVLVLAGAMARAWTVVDRLARIIERQSKAGRKR